MATSEPQKYVINKIPVFRYSKNVIGIDSIPYILLKALLRVCMENTARGGVSIDKYSMRRSLMLYLSRDTSPSAVFFVQTSKGNALGGILYFE